MNELLLSPLWNRLLESYIVGAVVWVPGCLMFFWHALGIVHEEHQWSKPTVEENRKECVFFSRALLATPVWPIFAFWYILKGSMYTIKFLFELGAGTAQAIVEFSGASDMTRQAKQALGVGGRPSKPEKGELSITSREGGEVSLPKKEK